MPFVNERPEPGIHVRGSGGAAGNPRAVATCGGPASAAGLPPAPGLGASKRVAIVQSNYIPWKGYFDLIASVDEFVLLDCVQYTRRDWRNRNRIKSRNGLKWLTIPVEVKGRYLQRICETRISDPDWARDHWETIRHSYSRAPHFHDCEELLRDLYLTCRDEWLSDVNARFLTAICGYLGISTRILRSTDFDLPDDKTERLATLCSLLNATQYVSGPAARVYLDIEQFTRRGAAVTFFDYDGYPEYDQLYPPFEHAVSIIDLLVHLGPAARTGLCRAR